MSRLLAGKWLFFMLIGVLQVVLMFVWGALVFGLDLFTAKRLIGFSVMALATGAAAAAFGLLLATLCKSRAQLGGVSTIVILVAPMRDVTLDIRSWRVLFRPGTR